MKVLVIDGSPRRGGNCDTLISEMTKVFASLNVEAETLCVAQKSISGCLSCGYCGEHGKCVVDDIVNVAAAKFEEADGMIVVSPVYFGSPNGSVISFLDRLFYSTSYSKRYKVGAAFAVARRGGTTASFDVLNKYFTISGMPVASGDYWNNAFGREKGQAKQDAEGMRNARVVAKRMVFLMKAIADAKENYPELLSEEPRVFTHFIH
ncbi:MAG: flavodoxin family protein [Bacilli bacterium]|nr:flavodoxin family protein [Bacilli bacterium]